MNQEMSYVPINNQRKNPSVKIIAPLVKTMDTTSYGNLQLPKSSHASPPITIKIDPLETTKMTATDAIVISSAQEAIFVTIKSRECDQKVAITETRIVMLMMVKTKIF